MTEPQRIGPTPDPAKRVVETEEYVAMLARMIDAYGRRVAKDPAAMIFFDDLQQRFRDSVNVGLAQAADGPDAYGVREIGRVWGVSHVAVIKRIKQGRAVIEARENAAGVTRLADAVKPSVPALREQRRDWFESKGTEDYRVIPIGKHRKTA